MILQGPLQPKPSYDSFFPSVCGGYSVSQVMCWGGWAEAGSEWAGSKCSGFGGARAALRGSEPGAPAVCMAGALLGTYASQGLCLVLWRASS